MSRSIRRRRRPARRFGRRPARARGRPTVQVPDRRRGRWNRSRRPVRPPPRGPWVHTTRRRRRAAATLGVRVRSRDRWWDRCDAARRWPFRSGTELSAWGERQQLDLRAPVDAEPKSGSASRSVTYSRSTSPSTVAAATLSSLPKATARTVSVPSPTCPSGSPVSTSHTPPRRPPCQGQRSRPSDRRRRCAPANHIREFVVEFACRCVHRHDGHPRAVPVVGGDRDRCTVVRQRELGDRRVADVARHIWSADAHGWISTPLACRARPSSHRQRSRRRRLTRAASASPFPRRRPRARFRH